MSIALGRIKEEVTNPGPSNVLRFGCNVCEDNALSNVFADPVNREAPKVGLSKVWKSKQPEYSLGQSRKNSKPGPECCWLNLPE